MWCSSSKNIVWMLVLVHASFTRLLTEKLEI